jgi:hypothetical protein
LRTLRRVLYAFILFAQHSATSRRPRQPTVYSRGVLRTKIYARSWRTCGGLPADRFRSSPEASKSLVHRLCYRPNVCCHISGTRTTAPPASVASFFFFLICGHAKVRVSPHHLCSAKSSVLFRLRSVQVQLT